MSDCVFPFALRFHEKILAILPTKHVKASRAPLPASAGPIQNGLRVCGKLARVRRERLAEFSAIGVNPDTIPTLRLNQPEYRQFRKKRFALAIDDRLATVGVRNWFPLPKLEIMKPRGNGNRAAQWKTDF